MTPVEDLKAKLKRTEGQHTEVSRIRIHRAISWLRRAQSEESDLDARFIFLWIAFNAAYAQEFGPDQSEREQLRLFLSKLIVADSGKRLHGLMFRKFSGPIRVLIENQFVFEPFWRALREHDSSDRWKESFAASKKAAMHSVMGSDALVVLGVVFDRLYVLRNQLVHGGATWNSRVNRAQVTDGSAILGEIVPDIIDLMLDHPDVEWGPIAYPIV